MTTSRGIFWFDLWKLNGLMENIFFMAENGRNSSECLITSAQPLLNYHRTATKHTSSCPWNFIFHSLWVSLNNQFLYRCEPHPLVLLMFLNCCCHFTQFFIQRIRHISNYEIIQTSFMFKRFYNIGNTHRYL